eukprot:11978-Eustigmatos_ZCMA.PRE.1
MLGLDQLGFLEDLLGRAILNQPPEVHERRVIRNPRRLLHVVRHDGDRVVGLELVHQFFHLAGGDGVERGGGLVEQQHRGLDRHA